MQILVEEVKDGVFKGRTRNNKIVHIKHDKNIIGEFVHARITRARTWYLNGELV